MQIKTWAAALLAAVLAVCAAIPAAAAGVSSDALLDSLDPSGYGGAFFAGDGALVILALDEGKLLQNDMVARAVRGGADGVPLRLGRARYSMRELNAASEALFERREAFSLQAVGLDESLNTVAVYTTDTSEPNKAAIRAACPIDGLLFMDEPSARTAGREVYSLDYAGRTYQRVTGPEDLAAFDSLLEDYEPAPLPDEVSCGFLVVTPFDKFAIYLPEAPEAPAQQELSRLSRRLNAKYPRHIQWFSYMTPGRIASVSYSGIAGGSYSPNAAMNNVTYGVELETSDAGNLQKISDCLKGMTVLPAAEIRPADARRGVGSDPGIDWLRIVFDSGVTYSFTCDGARLALRSSDMDEEILYPFTDGAQFARLRDLCVTLAGARLTKW